MHQTYDCYTSRNELYHLRVYNIHWGRSMLPSSLTNTIELPPRQDCQRLHTSSPSNCLIQTLGGKTMPSTLYYNRPTAIHPAKKSCKGPSYDETPRVMLPREERIGCKTKIVRRRKDDRCPGVKKERQLEI